MTEFDLNEALAYQDADRPTIDRLEPYLESRRPGLSLVVHRARAATQRWRKVPRGYLLHVPTQNPLFAIDREEMLPVSARSRVQWELTEEGNAWFRLANWPQAAEAYAAAIQLALLNMDVISATQNGANLALSCAAGCDLQVGLMWSEYLIAWATHTDHEYRDSILVQALTSGRICLVKMNRWYDTAIDAGWVIDRIGRVDAIPTDTGCDGSVRTAMTAVGDTVALREWKRVINTLAATGSMPAHQAGEAYI